MVRRSHVQPDLPVRAFYLAIFGGDGAGGLSGTRQGLQESVSIFAFSALVLRRLIWLASLIVAAGNATVEQASASLIWGWNYSGAGVVASGTFTTDDTPDGLGFYLITSITGTRNGQTITG